MFKYFEIFRENIKLTEYFTTSVNLVFWEKVKTSNIYRN